MKNYKPQTKQWFMERIGKRIYRDNQCSTKGRNVHCCLHCKEVFDNGLIVSDEMHADYLAEIDADFANEGIYSNYRDKK